MRKIKIIPVEGKNGLYRIETDEDNKVRSIPEISRILRKPISKKDTPRTRT